MSDYFDALIRSSGLRIGGRSPSVEASPASADDLVEITEERVALPIAMTRRQDQPSPARAAVQDSVDIGSRVDDAHSPAPPVRTESHGSAAAFTATPPSSPVAPRMPVLSQPLSAASAEAAASSEERLDPVRIAMQWVAADPEARASQPSRSAQAVPTPPLPPAVRNADVVVEQVEMADRDSSPAAGRRARSAASEPAIRAIPTVPSRYWPDEQRGPDRASATHDRPFRTDEDEIVEISIGAINLHVEAPPQTVVQPPLARPQQPASTPRRERSGLSRRYLRSF